MKCRDCQLKITDFITVYDGRGMIEFSYCIRDIVAPKMVDPDVERDCEVFQEKQKEVVVKDAA